MPKKPQTKKSKKDEEEITELEPEEEVNNEEDNEEYEDIEEDEEDAEDADDADDADDEELDEGGEEEGKDCTLDKMIDDDNEYYDNDEEVEAQPDTTVEYVKKEERQSSAKLTKYEMVRILGERSKQLTMGAKPMIKNYKNLPYDKIAEEELKLNMIPYKIRRPLPNGKFELWTLDELNKDHLLFLLD